MLCTPAFGQTAVSKTDVRDFVFEKWGAYNFEDSSGKRYFTYYVQEPTVGMEGSLTPFLWEKSKDKNLMNRGFSQRGADRPKRRGNHLKKHAA